MIDSLLAGGLDSFRWLLDATLHAAVLAAIVWTLARYCKWLTPQFKTVLWLLVLARLVIPVPASDMSFFNFLPTLALPYESTTDLPSTTIDSSPTTHASPATNENPAMDHTAATTTPPSAGTTMSLWHWATLIWLIGVAASSVRLGLLMLSLGRKRAHWQPPTELALKQLWSRCLKDAGVRRPVELLVTNDVEGPVALGLFAPCVVLPKTMAQEMSQSNMRHILLHELMHVNRGDLRCRYFSLAVTTLHWFNPIAWWAALRLNDEMELACDASVLRLLTDNDRREYGHTLLRVVTQWTAPVPVAVLGFAQSGSLDQRVARISKYRRTPLVLTLLSVFLVGCFFLFGLSRKPGTAEANASNTNGSPANIITEYADHELGWTSGNDGVALPLPVEQEQEIAAMIREFGGWYSLDKDDHIDAVNMVYHYDWGPSWKGPSDADEDSRRTDNKQLQIDRLLAALPRLTRLHELLLQDTQVTDDTIHHVAEMTELDTFYLWDAKGLTDAGVRKLSGLTKLKCIAISDGNLSDDALEVFADLPNLEKLNLQSHHFTDAGLMHLQKAERLKSTILGLGGSRFSPAVVESLLDLPSIEMIGVQGTALPASTKAKFKRANVKMFGESEHRTTRRVRRFFDRWLF